MREVTGYCWCIAVRRAAGSAVSSPWDRQPCRGGLQYSVASRRVSVKPADLSKEIQEVLDRGTLPTHLADAIDAVRNIGNFAAHPMKSQHTGEILDVEPGEAEWTLDVLEELFDFYYVQPAKLAERKAGPNQKLEAAGKPPMK